MHNLSAGVLGSNHPKSSLHTNLKFLFSPEKNYEYLINFNFFNFQVDASVGTEIGTMTEPDCLGPLDPGTSVTLEGIVWNETDGKTCFLILFSFILIQQIILFIIQHSYFIQKTNFSVFYK